MFFLCVLCVSVVQLLFSGLYLFTFGYYAAKARPARFRGAKKTARLRGRLVVQNANYWILRMESLLLSDTYRLVPSVTMPWGQLNVAADGVPSA